MALMVEVEGTYKAVVGSHGFIEKPYNTKIAMKDGYVKRDLKRKLGRHLVTEKKLGKDGKPTNEFAYPDFRHLIEFFVVDEVECKDSDLDNSSDDLNNVRVPELQAIAREHGIEFDHSTTKKQLVKMLEDHAKGISGKGEKRSVMQVLDDEEPKMKKKAPAAGVVNDDTEYDENDPRGLPKPVN